MIQLYVKDTSGYARANLEHVKAWLALRSWRIVAELGPVLQDQDPGDEDD